MNQNYRPVRNTVRCIIDAFLYMKVNLTERPCYYHSNIFFSVYWDDCCKIQVFPDYFKSQNSVREKKTRLNWTLFHRWQMFLTKLFELFTISLDAPLSNKKKISSFGRTVAEILNFYSGKVTYGPPCMHTNSSIWCLLKLFVVWLSCASIVYDNWFQECWLRTSSIYALILDPQLL